MRSILTRVAATLGMLAVLAILSLLGFMGLSEMSIRSARAIDLAGSLRWQSQRLLRLATEADSSAGEAKLTRENALREFESRLDDPRLTAVVPSAADQPLRVAYDGVKRRWIGEMRQRLSDGARSSGPELAGLVSTYIVEIDGLVRLLEISLEDDVRKLRLLEVTALSLILLAGVASLWLLYGRVIRPLRDLMLVAERIEGGDLSGRVAVSSGDEVGQFKRNFNSMVDRLHRAQTALEERVREKTEQLAGSNRRLELLYKAVRQLSEHDFGHATVQQVLVDLGETLDASAVCLRAVARDAKLAVAEGREDAGAASPAAPHLESTGSCSHTDCGDCPARGSANFFHGERIAAEGGLIVTPLTQAGTVYGYLTVKLRREPEPWQIALTRAVRRHIEVALDHAQRVEGRRRAAVDEERASIARELHDSLAQALTYVNVQVSRLDGLDVVRRDASAGDIVSEIRVGVADAYRQLRELITAFRTRVGQRSFRLSVEGAVRDCRRRLGIDIQVDDRLGMAELSTDEQTHVLQIIREALANAAHHAKASAVRLALGDDPQRGLQVRVEDDGRGLPAPARSGDGHHGIAIMRERAARLGGRLEIGAREGGGTRVELNFVPAARRS